jgi:hypothetical protein
MHGATIKILNVTSKPEDWEEEQCIIYATFYHLQGNIHVYMNYVNLVKHSGYGSSICSNNQNLLIVIHVTLNKIMSTSLNIIRRVVYVVATQRGYCDVGDKSLNKI